LLNILFNCPKLLIPFYISKKGKEENEPEARNQDKRQKTKSLKSLRFEEFEV